MRYGNVGYVSVWTGSGLHEVWECGLCERVEWFRAA